MNRIKTIAGYVILPLLGMAALVLLWRVSSATWAPKLPSPLKTWEVSKDYVTQPFAKRGEMDQGILRFTWYSLILVAKGYTIGLVLGIPLGFFMGSSKIFSRIFDPIVQIAKPVSPLAWLPLGLVLFAKSQPAALFTIAMCSMWPTVLNVGLGVKSIPQDYLNVAKSCNCRRGSGSSRFSCRRSPYLFTGMRLESWHRVAGHRGGRDAHRPPASAGSSGRSTTV